MYGLIYKFAEFFIKLCTDTFTPLQALDDGEFEFAKRIEKLTLRDGIFWKDDVCIRKEPLELVV